MFKSWNSFGEQCMHCCACPNHCQGCDNFSSCFSSASAKAAPLNINKVSNSLLNFGRKLIAPAMASGGAVGAPAGGSSFPPSAMPIRSTVEAPQHHHHHQHHHHQAQQQRMMKSESMPVQLGKGKGETWGNVICLKDWRKSFYWSYINGYVFGGNKKTTHNFVKFRTSVLSTTAHLQCNPAVNVSSRMYKYYRKFWTFKKIYNQKLHQTYQRTILLQ